MTLKNCVRKTTCYDCKNIKCYHHGKKMADCPKYRCDRPPEVAYNCDNCEFINQYINGMRKEYGYEV